MFERRRRIQQTTTTKDFVQARRTLRGDESIPLMPGLADQIAACRAEMQRCQRQRPSTEALAADEEEEVGGEEIQAA